MPPAPLGKYQELVTAVVTAFVIIAAVGAHMIGFTHDFTFLDALALLGAGALYGKTSAANGYAGIALAAHRRLDLIGAPPAEDGVTPPAVTPSTGA